MHEDVAEAFCGAKEAEQRSFKGVEMAESLVPRAKGYQYLMTESNAVDQ
jgi:hypothetical protein